MHIVIALPALPLAATSDNLNGYLIGLGLDAAGPTPPGCDSAPAAFSGWGLFGCDLV